MNLRYDDDFVEAAVFVVFSGRRAGVAAPLVQRFNLQRERCYTVLDPDDRQTAFAALHRDCFREWSLEQVLLGFVNEYPLLQTHLNVLAFRTARTRKEEAAELYVSPENGRSGVVAMRPDRFRRDTDICDFLRHELMHLSDMVDPAFDYAPALPARGASRRTASERYRLLWDITIDGRLGAAHKRELHRALFDQAFHFWPATRREEVFSGLWTTRAARHEELLALACDPRDLAHADQPLPGGVCPLCGFSTFDWVDAAILNASALSAIHREFQDWSEAQGLCSRCAEVYAVLQENA